MVKRKWIYDVESYPNFFCITAKEVKKDRRGAIAQFVIDRTRNDIDAIRNWARAAALIGYYNKNYDDKVLAHIIQNNASASDLWTLTTKIIEGDKLTFDFSAISSLDLSNIKPSGKSHISLKQLAINLKHSRVQDLPYEPGTVLTELEKIEVLAYNVNDVEITEKLYWKLKSQIDLRFDVSEMFGVDATNETESGIADVVLEKLFRDRFSEMGVNPNFDEWGTDYEEIAMADCILPFVDFKSDYFKSVLKKLQIVTLKKQDGFRYNIKVKYNGITYKLGIGGIHSEDSPGIFKASDDSELIDADVTSYYPNLCIQHRIRPEHIGDLFLNIYQSILDERQGAKKQWKITKIKKFDTKQSILKITANAIVGKMGSDFHWLRDKKAFIQVTLNGQLALLMLIERLTAVGIEVISANTDGVVSIVRSHQRQLFDDVCHQWQIDTKFTLEYTNYKKYVRRDVNSYITLKTDGELKTKGCFVSDISLTKGYNHPIVPIALREYFVNEIPIETTITNHQDVYDFCVAQKTGSGFGVYANNGKTKRKLQKNNRYIVTNSGEVLTKESKGKVIRLVSDSCCQVVNDIDNSDPKSYGINYKWYIDKATEIVEQITPIRQVSLFDLL